MWYKKKVWVKIKSIPVRNPVRAKMSVNPSIKNLKAWPVVERDCNLPSSTGQVLRAISQSAGNTNASAVLHIAPIREMNRFKCGTTKAKKTIKQT